MIMFEKSERCKDRDNNNERKIIKPVAVEMYNQNMGGVDRMDRQLWVYMNTHRTVKWWKKLFIRLPELTYCKFKVVWLALHNGGMKRTAKLQLMVIHGLLDGYNRSATLKVSRNHALENQPQRLTERYFIAPNPKRQASGKPCSMDCIVCSDRSVVSHRTDYVCR